MSEYDNSELDIHEPVAFGQQLLLAREKAGMTLEEAARALNLKIEIVEAIEESAMEKLPPVTFVQGYVRSYARLVGLPEEHLLKEFEEEVPHELESELRPRPPSPEGANSQSPVIKLISMLVIVLAVVVLFYAVYSFYIERTERIEQASQAAGDAAMQLPPEAPLIEQQASVTEEEPLMDESAAVFTPDPADPVLAAEESPVAVSPQEERQPVQEATESAIEEAAGETVAESPREVTIEEIIPVATPQPITGGDVLALRAEQECWAEIVDASDIQMFYGTILPGRDLQLTGQAPFEVFLGNAPAVTLSLNSINIDMTKYIRSNNIAQFKLSVEDGRVRFH